MKKIVIDINIFYILLWWCHFQVCNWYIQTRRSASHRTKNEKKTYKVVLSHRQYCNYAIWGDSAHLLIILKKSNKEMAYFMFNWALLRSACFVYRQQHVPSACSTDSNNMCPLHVAQTAAFTCFDTWIQRITIKTNDDFIWIL